MKKNFAILAAAALIGALALTGCAQTGEKAAETAVSAAEAAAPGVTTVYLNDEKEETITVNAEASMSVEPDMAEISLGVVNEAETAEEAQNLNNEQIDRVVEKLKEMGVAEKSVQTTEFYIYPSYDYSETTERIVGYTATTYLKVTDLPIEEAGNVITECVRAGINTVNSLRYFSSQYDEKYQKALEQALLNARVKAQRLAETAGGELDSLPTVTEGYQDTAYRYDNTAMATAEMAAADEASGVTLNPGSLDVTARVTATYKIHLTGEAEAAAEG